MRSRSSWWRWTSVRSTRTSPQHNAGSLRVLEKCGFRVVGEQTSEEFGMRIDEVILRLDADPESAAT